MMPANQFYSEYPFNYTSPVMCQLCLSAGPNIDIDIVSINQNVIDIAALAVVTSHLTQDHSPLPALTDANVF